MTKIGCYKYVYGAGNTPNRKIKFFGDGNQVWGDVFGKRQGAWLNIGRIDETQMTKEGASTSKKVEIMMEARKENKPVRYPDDKPFNMLSYKRRVSVITHLDPTGNYRISISNKIGRNPNFETVEHLTFFDPT